MPGANARCRCRWSMLLLLVALTPRCMHGQAQAVSPAAQTAKEPGRPASSVPYPADGSPALRQEIATLLAGPGVNRAHWGIAVASLDGTPLLGLDEGRLFRPASTAKLFTTAAAMALLGPDETWTTTVRGDYDATTGLVTGDLVLAGAGDPDFGTSDVPYVPPQAGSTRPVRPASLTGLLDLANTLQTKGVKQVRGDIVGDDTLFPYEPYPEGWNQDDTLWGYGAPVSALSVADNQLLLTVTPGSNASSPATVTLDQYGVSYYTVTSDVKTLARGAAAGGVAVERMPGSHALRVYGSISAGQPPETEEIAIDDPAAFTAEALRGLLLARHITVTGTAHSRHQLPADPAGFLSVVRAGPSGCEEARFSGGVCRFSCPLRPVTAGQVLASHVSPTVSEDVTFTLKTSQNLHAEVLLRQIGRAVSCGDTSLARGAHVVRDLALHAGVDADDLLFFDGSGLSTKDLVTPRAQVTLLAWAPQQPWFAAWKAALPVGGVDGTLSSRFTNGTGVLADVALLRGRVFAKTGTLGESRALAGYVEAASGRTVAFSILVDDHLPGNSADRGVMDRIVAAIAAAE